MQDEIIRVREEAQKLKADGVNKIIVLGHSGLVVDKKLTEEVEEVDVVVGAHSHSFLFTGETAITSSHRQKQSKISYGSHTIANSRFVLGEPPSTEFPVDDYPIVIERESGSTALYVQAYAYGKYLGNIDVTFNDQGDVISWSGSPILLDSSIKEGGGF